MMRKGTLEQMPIHPDAEKWASELSDTELAFASYVLAGNTLTAAYKKTHRKAKDTTAASAGWKMARRDNVAAYLRAAREALWRDSFLSWAETRSILAKIARDVKADRRERIAAALADARLGGYDSGLQETDEGEGDLAALDAMAMRILPTLDIPSMAIAQRETSEPGSPGFDVDTE